MLCACDTGGGKLMRFFKGLIGGIGLISLLAAVIYFPIRLPGAFQDDQLYTCDSLSFGNLTENPCRQFWASAYYEIPNTITHTWDWGGAGWVIAIFAWICLAFLTSHAATTRSFEEE